MLLLWIFYGYFSVLCLLCLCACLYICALWSPAGKGLTSLLSFVVSNFEFVTFPIGILGLVWYLIVSIPNLCTLTFLGPSLTKLSQPAHACAQPYPTFALAAPYSVQRRMFCCCCFAVAPVVWSLFCNALVSALSSFAAIPLRQNWLLYCNCFCCPVTSLHRVVI